MFSTFRKLTGAAIVASLMFASSSAFASGSKMYRVTITNITNSIIFTPIVVASHRKKISIFELGEPASEALAKIAESGAHDDEDGTDGIDDILESNGATVKNSGGPLLPGDSITVEVSAAHGARRITVVSMMLPTNDGFIALNGVKAPKRGSVTYYSPGYDAGTEPNDELCISIPGPQCDGEGRSLDDGNDVGYVHIHSGIHGTIAGLLPDFADAVYDWRNPVAKITITRVRGNDHDDDDDDDDD
jgi:archaellum component FlaF (FlaF/FlaG flagellin family)